MLLKSFNENFKQIKLVEYDLFLLDYRLEEGSALELLKTFLQKADKAHFISKISGRDNFHFAESILDNEATQ